MKRGFYKIFIISIFVIFNSLLLSDDLVSFSVTVISQNQMPVSDAAVQIGDLLEHTDNSGKAYFKIFPAVYDISVSKVNHIGKKETIEVTPKSVNFIFKIEQNFTPVSIKVIDSLTGLPVVTSVKVTNTHTNISSFSYTNEGGEIVLELDKNSLFNLEIEENNYSKFSRNFDTSKTASSFLVFKLERLDSEAQFSYNVSEGSATFRILPSNSLYKEYALSGKTLTANIPFGKYEMTVNSPGYKPLVKIVNIDKQNFAESYTLLSKNRTYSLFVKADAESGFTFQETLRPSAYPVIMKNTTINIFSGDILTKSVQFNGKEETISVPFGKYNLEVKNELADTYVIENLELGESTPQYLLISLKQMFATIKGVVNLGTYLTGGVNITFQDQTGNEYQTVSDIDGSYSIKLPARNYTLNASKEGYNIRDKKSLTVQASIPNETYTCNIDIEEVKSIITGKVTGLNGLPVGKARVTVKVEKDESTTYTDDDGRYTLHVNSGLAFIKIDKSGYKSKGTVKTVNRFSTVTGLDFILEEILTSIEGVITDGVIPLDGIQLKLLSSNNSVVSRTISKASGAYVFEGIKTISDYYIAVENENYSNYLSPKIEVKFDQVKGYNITLKRNQIKVILEIKDSAGTPIVNEDITIDGKVWKSDITGFIELEYPITSGIKKVLVTADKYKVSETLIIDDKTLSPLKKSIIINK